MPDIVVIGNFVVDLIGKPIDRLPARGRLELIETLETHPGGNGPNTAGALGKLGADVVVCGKVGRDLYGRFLLERLDEWGVDTSQVRVDETTGLTLVPVDSSGERSFLHIYGANASFGPEDLDWNVLSRARHLHLSGFFVLPRFLGDAAAGVLREARRNGLTTSVDCCWDRAGRWMEDLRPCLPHVDFCMPSEEEARHLTGCSDPAGMAQVFLEAGAGAAVIKLGEQGCYYSDPSNRIAHPAFRVAVRDTTGAGDCFIAGFLLSRLQGRDLPDCLRFANACGALAVSEVGGVTGLQRAERVRDWMARARLREG